MMRYEVLKITATTPLSDGVTPEEFSALLPAFSKRFALFVKTKTLDGKDRKKRQYTRYKNSCFSGTEDMLLFILIYLRKAMTQDVLGAVFGIDQPVANKWVHLLLPIVNEALSDLGVLPFSGKRAFGFLMHLRKCLRWILQLPVLFFHDGVERPIQRPKALRHKRPITVGKRSAIASKTISSLMPRAKSYF